PILDKASSTNSRAVIDACRPYERLNDFPPVARASPELVRQVEAKFAEVLRGVMGRQGTYLLTGNAGCQYVRVPLSTYAGRALLGKGFYTTISLCFQSVTLHKAIAENQVISVDQVHTNGTLAGHAQGCCRIFGLSNYAAEFRASLVGSIGLPLTP